MVVNVPHVSCYIFFPLIFSVYSSSLLLLIFFRYLFSRLYLDPELESSWMLLSDSHHTLSFLLCLVFLLNRYQPILTSRVLVKLAWDDAAKELVPVRFLMAIWHGN